LPIFVENFLKESYRTNITYFQVRGTPFPTVYNVQKIMKIGWQ